MEMNYPYVFPITPVEALIHIFYKYLRVTSLEFSQHQNFQAWASPTSGKKYEEIGWYVMFFQQ